MDKIATVKNKVKYAEWISMVEDCQRSVAFLINGCSVPLQQGHSYAFCISLSIAICAGMYLIMSLTNWLPIFLREWLH